MSTGSPAPKMSLNVIEHQTAAPSFTSVMFVTETRARVAGFRVPTREYMTVKELAAEAVHRLAKTVLNYKGAPKEVYVRSAYVTDDCSLFFPDRVAEVVDVRHETVYFVLKGWKGPQATEQQPPPPAPSNRIENTSHLTTTTQIIPNNHHTLNSAGNLLAGGGGSSVAQNNTLSSTNTRGIESTTQQLSTTNSVAAGIRRQVSDHKLFASTVEVLAASPINRVAQNITAGVTDKKSPSANKQLPPSEGHTVSMPHPQKKDSPLSKKALVPAPKREATAKASNRAMFAGSKTTRGTEEAETNTTRQVETKKARTEAPKSQKKIASQTEKMSAANTNDGPVRLSQMTTPEREEFYAQNKSTFGTWGPDAHKFFPEDYEQNPDALIRKIRKEARLAKAAAKLNPTITTHMESNPANVNTSDAKISSSKLDEVLTKSNTVTKTVTKTAKDVNSSGEINLNELSTPEREQYYKEHSAQFGAWGKEAHKYYDANYEADPDKAAKRIRQARLAREAAAKSLKKSEAGMTAATAVEADNEEEEYVHDNASPLPTAGASVKTVAAPASHSAKSGNTQPHLTKRNPHDTTMHRSPPSITAGSIVALSLPHSSATTAVSRSLLTAYDDDIVEICAVQKGEDESDVKKEGWGVDAHKYFDSRTYCSDPKKAIIPEEILRQPIRTRRQHQLLADQLK